MAEGGGLLNRYRLVKAYRGFESLRLRHNINKINDLRHISKIYPLIYPLAWAYWQKQRAPEGALFRFRFSGQCAQAGHVQTRKPR